MAWAAEMPSDLPPWPFEAPADARDRASTVHLRGFKGPVDPHAHPNFQLVMPIGTQGQMRFLLAAHDAVEVKEPQWLLFWPGVRHGLEPSPHSLEFIALQMTPQAMSTAWGSLRVQDPRPECGAKVLPADALLRELIYEIVGLQAAPDASEALKAIAYAHLCMLTARLTARRPSSGSPTRPVPLTRASFDSDYVTRAVTWMRDHIEAPMVLAELARRAATSPRNLTRHFKRELGVSPGQYMTLLRIDEAARRLVETKEPITTIALDVGYNSLSHFIHQFREIHGCSPGMHRQAHARR